MICTLSGKIPAQAALKEANYLNQDHSTWIIPVKKKSGGAKLSPLLPAYWNQVPHPQQPGGGNQHPDHLLLQG